MLSLANPRSLLADPITLLLQLRSPQNPNSRDGALVTRLVRPGESCPCLLRTTARSSCFAPRTCSSGSDDSSSDGTDTDEGIQQARGRTESRHGLGNGSKQPLLKSNGAASNKRTGKARGSSSQSSSSRRSSPVGGRERVAFTRSRSPAVRLMFKDNGHWSLPHRTSSPSLFSRTKHLPPPRMRYIFPASVSFNFRLSLSKAMYTVSMDVRQAIENLLLLSSLGFVAVQLRTCSTEPFSQDMWISIGNVPDLSSAPLRPSNSMPCPDNRISPTCYSISNLLHVDTPSTHQDGLAGVFYHR